MRDRGKFHGDHQGYRWPRDDIERIPPIVVYPSAVQKSSTKSEPDVTLAYLVLTKVDMPSIAS